MQYYYDVITGGTFQQVAHHPFEDPDVWSYVCCPCQSDYSWMQQDGLDPAVNYQIIMMCKITPTQGHELCRFHMEMNDMSIIDNKGHSKNPYYH